MPKPWISLLFFALLLFSACGPEVIFKQQKELPDSGWTYSDTLDYRFEIADTQRLYNLFLTLGHSTDFGYQNLYVKIYTGFPNGQRLSQRLSIDVADKIGRWLGDCRGEQCTLEIPIQTNAYFNQVGEHYFTLEQFMRIDPLPGIQSASFRIEVSEQKRQ